MSEKYIAQMSRRSRSAEPLRSRVSAEDVENARKTFEWLEQAINSMQSDELHAPFDFLKSIEPPVRSGIHELDVQIGGGLRGLTIISGVPGIGTTSLALQIAGNIAEQGIPVFCAMTIESSIEVMARLVARTAMQNSRKRIGWARIIDGRCRENSVTKAEKIVFDGIARNLYVSEGCSSIDAIRDMASSIKQASGQSPVIVVDRIQDILSGDSDYAEIGILLDIGRELKTPIVATSAISRYAYHKTLELLDIDDAIRETAGVLLGIEREKGKGKDGIYDCEIVTLKNRYGANDGRIDAAFDGRTGLFSVNKLTRRQ